MPYTRSAALPSADPRVTLPRRPSSTSSAPQAAASLAARRLLPHSAASAASAATASGCLNLHSRSSEACHLALVLVVLSVHRGAGCGWGGREAGGEGGGWCGQGSASASPSGEKVDTRPSGPRRGARREGQRRSSARMALNSAVGGVAREGSGYRTGSHG